MLFFGLDIGSDNLKAIQLERKEGKLRIVSAGMAKISGLGISSEAEKDLISLAENIKKLKSDTGIITDGVVCSLPESAVFTRVIDLPSMTEKEVGQALKWELEEIVPIPLAEASFDWQVVKRDQSKISVLVAVSPTSLINKYLHLLELAQLQPLALETEVLAVVRALAFVAPGKTKLIIDIGARSTNIVVAKDEEIFLTRSLPSAGKALTRAIATKLSLEEEVAEEYKKNYGLTENQLENQVSSAISPILESVIEEIQKSIGFVKNEKKEKVELLVLSGGSAGLPGISELITSKIGIEIQLANPFSQLTYDEKMASSLVKIAPSFVVPVGLAMREI